MSQQAAPLDDVMLAMDVVDTLRHQNALIEKELSEGDREAALIQQLRDIYARQGIAVPEDVLLRGVKELREDRFTYKPPANTLSYTLAKVWARRKGWGKTIGLFALAFVVAVGGFEFGIRRPAERAREAARIELTEGLPKRMDTLLADIQKEALEESAKKQAEALVQQGKTAARDGQREAAQASVAALEALRNDLRQSYIVKVVSRPGEITGTWRVPTNNPNAQRSYYIIVEAIGPDGKVVPRPVTAETDGKTKVVSKWGQHVPKSLYDKIADDKRNDGIVQNNVMGVKERGRQAIDWQMPVDSGAITEWADKK